MFDCKLEHSKKIVFVRWFSSLHGNQLGLWDCDIATMKLWFFSKLWFCKNETVKQMIKRGGDITLRNSLKERLWSVVSALTGSTKARITSSFFIQPFNCQRLNVDFKCPWCYDQISTLVYLQKNMNMSANILKVSGGNWIFEQISLIFLEVSHGAQSQHSATCHRLPSSSPPRPARDGQSQ